MPNDLSRVYSAIGMANKAGKIISGTDSCIRAIKTGKVELIIMSEDASDNTRKKIMNACSFRNISCVVYGKGGMLGKVTGKSHRIVAGVRDKNLSKLILSKMQQERELMNE